MAIFPVTFDVEVVAMVVVVLLRRLLLLLLGGGGGGQATKGAVQERNADRRLNHM